MATPGQLVHEIARLWALPRNAVLTPWRLRRAAGRFAFPASGVCGGFCGHPENHQNVENLLTIYPKHF